MTKIAFPNQDESARGVVAYRPGMAAKAVEDHDNRIAQKVQIASDRARSQQLENLDSDLGNRYRGCSLESFEVYERKAQQPVLDQLRGLSARLVKHTAAGLGLVLYGPAGTGKDHLLAAMLRDALGQGLRVMWVPGVAIVDGRRIEHAEGAIDVLAISDPIRPDECYPSVRNRLLRLLDQRYRARRSTWCTLNVSTPAEADSGYGAPVIDRLRDGAECCFCNWPSYRTGRV